MHRLLWLVPFVCLPGCPGDGAAPASSAPPTVASSPAAAAEEPSPPTVEPAAEQPLGWVADASSAPIPAQPITGVLNGRAFTAEEATVENGRLEVRQGDDFFADLSVSMFLDVEEGHLPAGRTYTATPETGMGDSPSVHMSWRPDSDSMPKTEFFMSEHTLRVEFGQVDGDTIPFKLRMAFPDEAQSWVAGEGVAKLEGFYLVDGEVDYTQDALTILELLAKEHLGDGQPVEIEDTFQGMLSHADPKGRYPQWGRQEIAYTVAGGPKQFAKLLYLKNDEGWYIAKQLGPAEVAEAHPQYEAPADDTGAKVRLVAARWLEDHIAAERPDATVTHTSVNAGYGKLGGTARIEYRYADQEQPTKLELALARDGDAWTAIRPLEEGERFNSRTGEIEAR